MGKIHTTKSKICGDKTAVQLIESYGYNKVKGSAVAYDYTITAPTSLTAAAQTTYSFKNKLINGDMSIWQRMGSASLACTSGVANYGPDRYAVTLTGTSVAASIQRQTFTLGQTTVTDNPEFFSRVSITNGGDSTAGRINLQYLIEGVEPLAGRTATLSFWAKADTGRNIAVSIRQSFGSGGSPSALVSTYISKFAITSSWVKYTFTFSVPSITGKVKGTDDLDVSFLGVYIWMTAGSNFSAETNTLGQTGAQTSTFDFAMMQLEEGSSATSFEKIPYAINLMLCRRYCLGLVSPDDTVTVGRKLLPGVALSATSCFIYYLNKMRRVPNVKYSLVGRFSVSNGSTDGVCGILTAGNNYLDFNATYTAYTGAAAGDSVYLTTAATITSSDYIYLDAEL